MRRRAWGPALARVRRAALATARQALPALVQDAADAVFDPRCAAGDHELGRLAGPACDACTARLHAEAAPRCPSCSGPSSDGRACGSCAARPRRMTVHAPRRHAGVARALVLAVKQGRREDACAVLAAATATDPLVQRALAEADVLVPVPADRLRRRERGFDHAAVLARELARRADGRRPRVVAALSLRGGAGKQSARSARERRRALRARMRPRLHASLAVSGRRVVLVDDVVTTGATLTEAARVLLKAGAREVHAIACTRADGQIADTASARRRR